MPRVARLLVTALLAAGALAGTGCADKADIRTIGDTEGLYIDVGPLVYQVQISRYMNQADTEDKSYFLGLPASQKLARDETWFGVFLRVQNYTSRPQTPATDMRIVDTQNNQYRPFTLDTRANPFAYNPQSLVGGGVLPDPDSAAAQGPIGGSL